MGRSASLATVALLGVLGCQGGNEATSIEQDTATVVLTTTPTPTPIPIPTLTPEARVLQWITSCEVRRIVITHENVAYIRLRGGERRRVHLGGEASADKVFAAATKQRCPDFQLIIGIE